MKTWIFFILLFHLLAGTLVFAQAPHAQPFANKKREGVYRLQQGTDGCAEEIIWKSLEKCAGFQLTASLNGQVLDPKKRELFCHINKGSGTEVRRTDRETIWNIRYNVSADENMVRKIQHIRRDTRGTIYQIDLQASVILDRAQDGGNSFVFDRSLGSEGTSCLYKK